MQVNRLNKIPFEPNSGQEIARGSYGIVRKVVHENEVYATKQIDPSLYESVSNFEPNLLPELKRYSLRECVLLSELDHPNVVDFIGVCITDDDVVLVMEYLPLPLDVCLDRCPDIPIPCKLKVLLDVARAVEYLHDRSPPLIHRDISTKNILLKEDSTAKLADIGSAVAVGTRSRYRGMTPCPGAMICMPPEAMNDRANYDEKLDIFSLGVVFLHVLLQEWPIPSETVPSGCQDMDPEVQCRLEFIEKLEKDPDAMGKKDLIMRCLQSNPNSRPSAAQISSSFGYLGYFDPHEVLETLTQSISRPKAHIVEDANRVTGSFQTKLFTHAGWSTV